MRNRILYLISGLLLLVSWQSVPAKVSTQPQTDPGIRYAFQGDDFVREVVDLTNGERVSAGLPILTFNALLTQSAQGHAEAMAAGNFFDHVNPLTGLEPKDRITATGYQWNAIGENIASGQTTPQEVMQSWMNSQGHRENILSPDFTEIGIGYYQKPGDAHATYWVQNFGRPVNGGGSPPVQVPVQDGFRLGDIFASVGDGQVNWYRPDGSLVKTLDTNLGGQMAGLAFDSAGNLYVTNFGAGTVSQFDSAGILLGEFGSGYSGNPESIIIDQDGNFFVGAVDGDNDIRKFDSSGRTLGQYDVSSSGHLDCVFCRGSDWIDLAADGCTMYYTSESSSVKRYDICSDRQLDDFASGLEIPAYALRLLPDGSVLVANDSDIKLLDSNGQVTWTYDVPGEDCWFALNRDPDGKSFWSGDTCSGRFYRFDTDTGEILLGPIQACSNESCLAGLTVFGELTESAPTPMPAFVAPTLISTATLDPLVSTPMPSDLVTMTITADPQEAGVEAPISVEITITGDSKSCGQSVVVKPIDVFLVLDRSGSMDGEPLIRAKEAAKAFIDEMDLNVDRIGIVQFDDSAQVIQNLSSDISSLKSSVDSIISAGGTSISDGLNAAFDALKAEQRSDALPVIVLLSDGQSDPISATFVAETAKAAGMRIVTVGLGDVSPAVLTSIASTDDKGKPRYYESPDPGSLKSIYISIARDIREYGLAKDLTLRYQLNVYDFALIPESLEKEAVVAGDTITWKREVLSSGSTTFSFQVWGRKPGEFDIGSLTEATFLQCEQTNNTLQIGPGPKVNLEDIPPESCPTCAWWQLFPWWLILTVLFLVLVGLLLWLTPLGYFLRGKRSTLCKLMWSLFYFYLTFLAGLFSYNLLGNLCQDDQIYFWKITQDQNVGVYVTGAGDRSADPIRDLNQNSNCVACHALGGTVDQPLLSAVRDDQNGDIVINSLGGEEIPLPQVNGSYMAWSPDGKKVAISLNDTDIQILDIETGNLTPLAGASGSDMVETMPAWSPDGKMIAFVRAPSVPQDSARIDMPSDIYVVPATGGVALPLPGASGEGFNYYPAYSPNGKWLAFTRHVNGQDTYGDNASDIYLVPAQGGDRILLRANNDEWADTWPTWSSDGQILGFSSNRQDQQFDILLTSIGSNGQSNEACLLPGAAAPADEEFHPIWLKAGNVPWWQRALALLPWLIPVPILLISAILACRRTVTFIAQDIRTKERVRDVKITLGEKK